MYNPLPSTNNGKKSEGEIYQVYKGDFRTQKTLSTFFALATTFIKDIQLKDGDPPPF
jgi:hypothetical protein